MEMLPIILSSIAIVLSIQSILLTKKTQDIIDGKYDIKDDD